MRVFIPALFILLLSCNFSKPIQDSAITVEESAITAEEKELAKDLIQGAFDDLWAGMDSSKIHNYHTDDFVILEHGEVWDNERIKQFMREQLANENRAKRINKMDYIFIDKYGESIQIAYHNKAEFFVRDSLVWTGAWLESALAIKTSEGWRLKMMHSTRKVSK